MKNKKTSVIIFACLLSLLFFPSFSKAISGENIKNTKVKVYTKQGGEWFKSRTIRTTHNGTLIAKDVLPGRYKMTIDDSDERNNQSLGLRLKMLDNKGRKIKDKTDVDLYMYISGSKVAIGTVETDDSGWLETEGLLLDTVYALEIDDEEHISKKENTYRIKTKVKIEDSDWFYGQYKRTDENKILEAENVLPGKYKFKYKSGETDSSKPFILKARMLNEKGKKIKEPTKVKIYAYIEKTRQLLGTLMTDSKGWVTLPNVMTKMKYKIKVKD